VGYLQSRGGLIWLRFAPQAGHERAGRRPEPVRSPRRYNARAGLALVCPITSRVKGCPLPPGLALEGGVLADQVRSLDGRPAPPSGSSGRRTGSLKRRSGSCSPSSRTERDQRPGLEPIFCGLP